MSLPRYEQGNFLLLFVGPTTYIRYMGRERPGSLHTHKMGERGAGPNHGIVHMYNPPVLEENLANFQTHARSKPPIPQI